MAMQLTIRSLSSSFTSFWCAAVGRFRERYLEIVDFDTSTHHATVHAQLPDIGEVTAYSDTI